MMNSKDVKILWTGGWDSTFQLLRLLLIYKHPVTPYYLIDADRPSTRVEILTIQRIKEYLFREFPHTRSLLKPTLFYSVNDISPNAEITKSYKEILKHKSMGGQYDWLARFCKQNSITDMHLCIHRDDKAHFVIEHIVSENEEDSLGGCYVDASFNSTREYALFQFYLFPIFNLSKVEMASISANQGWEEIMGMTWFCHSPTRSMKPCGRCNPCVYTINEGLGWRIPASSQISAIFIRRIIRPLKPFAKRLACQLGISSAPPPTQDVSVSK